VTHPAEGVSTRDIIDGLDLDVRTKRALQFEDITITTGTMTKHLTGTLAPFFEIAVRRRQVDEIRARIGSSTAVLDRSEQTMLYVVGASHVGKTQLAKQFAFKVVPEIYRGPSKKPVAMVSLKGASNVKDVVTQILAQGFDDPGDVHTAAKGIARINRLAESHETALIVIDECQHMVHPKTDARDRQVTDFLKSLVISGRFSLMLVGQAEQVYRLLRSDAQYENRAIGIELTALDQRVPDQWTEFLGFLAYLDKQMAARGIFATTSGLAQSEFRYPIYEASFGLLGRVKKLIYQALVFEVEIGAERLTIDHLAAAIERNAALKMALQRNPFRSGARPVIDLRKTGGRDNG
jgi:hypothetical protein